MIPAQTNTHTSKEGDEKMARDPFIQVTLKFPTGKERYRQAVELLSERDKGMYPTQADYVAAAILVFEGNLLDERTSLNLIMQEMVKIGQKMDEIYDEQKKGNP